MTTTETTTALQARRDPINIDIRQGVGITNYKEAMQMAALVHNSGLAPRSLDTVQKVAVAMLMAVEVGLPVITGLQNIAIINGKAGIWGDAILSLVRSSGQLDPGYPKERVEGTPFTDGWTFYCTVKRKGGSEVTGSFSWAEAKRAGFDSPKLRSGQMDPYSPWTRFPRRMMQWKSRQWVYRDEFGDVLRGMRMAEELHDVVDLEVGSEGGYSMPTTDVQASETVAPDPVEKAGFDELLPNDIDRAMVEQYAAQCAQRFGQDLAEFKRQLAAGTQMEEFLQAFYGWVSKNLAEELNPNKVPDKAAEAESKETAPDPWAEFRDEFINLRSAGFSTWLFKNKTRLSEAPQEIQDEAKAKWGKLYTGNPWPLDPVTEEGGDTGDKLQSDTNVPPDATAQNTTEKANNQTIPAPWDMPKIVEPFIQTLGKGVAYEIMGTDNPAKINQENRLPIIEALRKAAEK